MHSKHCIIYADRSSHNRKSAIIFNDKVILTPATVLLGSLSRKAVKKITQELVQYNMIDVTYKEPASNHALIKEMTSLKFNVAHKRQKSLVTSTALIRYVFNCKTIAESVDNLLDNFESLLLPSDGYVPTSTDTDSELNLVLLSSFVVLALDNSTTSDIIETFLPNRQSNGVIRFDAINKLDDIASVTTPFTNEVFFGTVNLGKVANIFGQDECLFVASHPLVSGCEGGAVYSRRMKVIGMVICTSFRWKRSQNASLTLIASFGAIVKEFVRQSKYDNLTVSRSSSSLAFYPNLEKSVLLVQIGFSGGTGCLLKINSYRFILTCSHVVFTVPSNCQITCYYNKGSFTSDLIYKNPNFAQAYDIALLSVPDNIPDAFFTRCDPNPASVGDIVYATGFPHFFALAKQTFAPSIFEGRVTKVDRGLIFTDASVQAGQSGGPLLNAAGQLVGVMVSNSRDTNDQIYPNVNMCIPVCDIYETLAEFCNSRDVAVLDGLVADKAIVRRWNLQPVLASKL